MTALNEYNVTNLCLDLTSNETKTCPTDFTFDPENSNCYMALNETRDQCDKTFHSCNLKLFIVLQPSLLWASKAGAYQSKAPVTFSTLS